MLSLRRIFGLMLLFFFFEAVVAVVTSIAYKDVSVFLACVAMTGLAVGVWAVFALVTRLMARPRAPQMPAPPKSPVAPGQRPVSSDDSFTQELSVLVAEANRRLAGTTPANARGEAATIATLPLYLVIGGEGVGKTSAMLNSGLEPSLLAGEAARDGNVAPTRLCNLWFAQGAVFADLAGRVLAQEPQNWERALRFFSQPFSIPRWKQIVFGQRSPVNLKGIVLVCDAGLFARANDAQRTAAFARTLSDRLQIAGAVFRKEFPVYVVFSKCDGLQYFSEFFAHLSEPEGRRLLGATLPYVRQKNDAADIYADREGKRLTNYFSRLYMSLAEKRLVLLAREDQAAKKSMSYEFPRELKKLRGDVVQFLLDVFRPNPLQLGPRLRGFYLSGQRWVARNVGTSEGTMAGFTVVPKRTEATILFGVRPGAPAAAPPRSTGPAGAVPKWMFLTDLFHNVILKDRAGSVAPRVNTREREYRYYALAGAGALLLLLSVAWANSWRHNRELLNSVQAAVDAVGPAPAHASFNAESLKEMDTLQGPLSKLLGYERSGAPFSYRWGLYSGQDVTGPLKNLYFDRFRRTFMDPVVNLLTTHFSLLDPSAPVQDDVYSLLKSYRMITSGECKPDAGFLNSTLIQIWSNAVSGTAADAMSADSAALAERQVQFYIGELLIRNPYRDEIPENGNVVRQAQRYLREFNGPDQIFHGLIVQVNRAKQGDTLGHYVPNYQEVLTGPDSIDFAYTREGWEAMMDNIRNHKLNSAGEACVVGGGGMNEFAFNQSNERSVEGLYVQNYIEQWKTFLAAHHVEPFRNNSDASQKLRLLADNNRSPLLGLVYMASHNTDLGAHSGESTVQVIEDKAKNGITGFEQRLFGKQGANSPNPAPEQLVPTVAPSGADVEHAFEPARALVDPAHPEKWLNASNQPYIQALDELGNSMVGLPTKVEKDDQPAAQALDRAEKALEAARTAHHALGAAIPNSSSGIDAELTTLLLEPITYAAKVIEAVPRRGVERPQPPVGVIAGVNSSARALCASVEGLYTKYPFNPLATQDAGQQDLNDVLAPATGALSRFEQSQNVTKAYTHQGRVWAPSGQLKDVDYSPTFPQSLGYMTELAQALYADGGNAPRFEYTISLDGTGNVPFEVDIDGHTLRFTPGKPSPPEKLAWPPFTNVETKLTIEHGKGIRILKWHLGKPSKSFPAQFTGLWSIFRLLDAADQQNGNVFTFRSVQFANSHVPIQGSKGNPATLQIRVDSPAVNIFSKGYFTKLRCETNFTKALWLSQQTAQQ